MMMDESDYSAEELSDRIMEVESLLMHHQKVVSDLNDVVTRQAEEQIKLQRKIEFLNEKLQSYESLLSESRELSDEKPPHY